MRMQLFLCQVLVLLDQFRVKWKNHNLGSCGERFQSAQPLLYDVVEIKVKPAIDNQ